MHLSRGADLDLVLDLLFSYSSSDYFLRWLDCFGLDPESGRAVGKEGRSIATDLCSVVIDGC